MKTPGAIATDALTGYPLGRDLTREDVWQIVHDAIEADRAQRDEQNEDRARLVDFLNEQLDGYESEAEARAAWRSAFPYDAQQLINTVRAAL